MAISKDEQRLLIIDDDIRLTEAMALYLRRSGYAVSVANKAAEGIERFRAESPHLVILDVMMPGTDGWEVCRRLREVSSTPIIMLTARDSESDRVMGLRMGADDYVGKPFSLKELEARVEAVLRRVQPAPAENHVVFDDGRLRLEAGSLRVSVDGELVHLTATERRLLFTLVGQAGRVLGTDQILRLVWGPEYEGQSDYVKLYIWRLRQKIERDPTRPSYIQTERGLGYRFVGEGSGEASGSTAPDGVA